MYSTFSLSPAKNDEVVGKIWALAGLVQIQDDESGPLLFPSMVALSDRRIAISFGDP